MFVDLPLDIHLAVFGFLDSLDILAVGKTCQVLHKVALQRAVWTTALKKMCAINAVYTPSFKSGDLSIAELQKAVSGPDRMIELLQKGVVGRDEQLEPLVPPRTHIIDAPLEVSGIESFFTAVYIVPGGRYLVTTGNELLHIWDLNRPLTIRGIRVPLFSQPISRVGDHNCVFCICPGSDPGIFRVVLSGTWVEEDDSKMAKLMIYEFSEDSQQDGLKLYQTPLNVNFNNDGSGWHVDVFSVHENIFVYVCGRDLHVWNFVEDTCTSWTTPELEFEEMFIDAYRIILVTRSSVLIWDIPDLHPRTGIPIRRSEEIKPRFSMQQNTHPNPTEPVLAAPATSDSCQRIPDWYNRSHTLQTFDVLSGLSEEGPYTLSTFSIALPTPEFGGMTKPISSLELPSSSAIVMDARVCNDHIVKGWRDENCHVLLLAPLCSDNTSVNDLRMQRFEILDEGEVEDMREWGQAGFSFDPVSGRLCIIVNEEEGGSIWVFDLLSYD